MGCAERHLAAHHLTAAAFGPRFYEVTVCFILFFTTLYAA
jgi:hypothetical protein